MNYEQYSNPLIGRYASEEMTRLWSPMSIQSTWRKLWVALAEAEQELGIGIRSEQIDELRREVDNIDFEKARRYEREFRHDVMAHVHTFGDACPNARPIIHLGATSCFVTDNTDLILMRTGLRWLRDRLVLVIDRLARFATQHRELACLAYTHLQPAQPTTVGKRATLWCYDLVLDLEDLEHRLATLRFRGAKGTTGTQASFLELFQGDHAKCEQLDRLVAGKFDFAEPYAVTGQTYSRKVDAQILGTIAGIAQSAHKFATDLRLLQSFREMEEPFEAHQIGSSAMAYKRNPMRAERICGLARFATSLVSSAEQTASVQWMERTLDDSANRRLIIPQAFLAADAILLILRNVVEGLVVHPAVIDRRLRGELPFMATEAIMMAGVKAGKDRQHLHERIRVHSVAAANRLKDGASDNDLFERLQADPDFAGIAWEDAFDTRQFVGRAPEQVDAFVRDVVDPIRQRYPHALTAGAVDLKV